MVNINEIFHLMHKFGLPKMGKTFDGHGRLSVDVTEDCRLEADFDQHRVIQTITWIDEREEMPDENLYFAPFEDSLFNIFDLQERLIKAMANSLRK